MSERIVPSFPADSVPISGLEDFQNHLRELENDASIPLNVKLLDDIQLQLTEANIPPLLPAVLPPLTQILKTTTQDPTPLLSLTIKLLSPLTFARTLTIADPPSIVAALTSPLPGANLLALAIIHKATKTPSEAALLSTLPEVVEELVSRWLDSPDVGVGERAAKVLGDLLETDCEVVPEEGVNGVASQANTNGTNGINGIEVVKRRMPGHARLWRLVLLERPILSHIKALCTPETAADSPARSLRQTSLSQGRLLRLLPRLATLDIRAVNRTPFPDLFQLPSAVIQVAGQGLLQWAALGMVAKSDDILMHLNLIDFFEAFVSIMRVSGRSAEQDAAVKSLVRAAVQDDEQLRAALRGLPDRTVEEAEPLRKYITEILG